MVIHFFKVTQLGCKHFTSIFPNSSNRLFHLKKILIPRREFNKVYVEINGIISTKKKKEQKVTFCYQQLLRWNKEEDKTSEMSLIAKSVK